METKDRLLRLREAIRGRRKATIVTHNNPDPDGIASAFGLKGLLFGLAGIESEIRYGGIVARAENRLMIQLLRIEMKPYRPRPIREDRLVAVVDTQPGGMNLPLEPKARVDLVVDHHPLRKATAAAAFQDIRPGYGSCSAIITEYLREAGLPLGRRLATALYYGIKTDTSDYSREIAAADISSMHFLFPHASLRLLHHIENPRLSRDFYSIFCEALGASRIYGDVLVATLEHESPPDLLAQMSDQLIKMKGIRWVFVCGPRGEACYFSLRGSSRRSPAGRLAHRIAGSGGSGGGHERSAGGQVPAPRAGLEERRVLCRQMAARFLKIVHRDHLQPEPLIIREDLSKEGSE